MTRHLRTAVLLMIVAPVLGAQVADSTRAAATVPAPKTILSLNPILLVLPILSGDFERVVSPTVTLGVGGSINGNGEWNHYGALEAKVRFYFAETAPTGFSIAGTLGMASASENVSYAIGYIDSTYTYGSSRQHNTRATVGTELSYQWLLGPKKRFAIVLGLGVKRFLGSASYIFPTNTDVLPTGRTNIGIAF
jgi:hypothetical protein